MERAFPALLFLLFLVVASPAGGEERSSADKPASPDGASGQNLDQALDQALTALAESMQTLSRQAEQGLTKLKQCRSGTSKDPWCLKMRDALDRLDRLERSMREPDEVLP